MLKVDIGLYLPGTQEALQSISPSEVKAALMKVEAFCPL